jgi:hypothetical protein
VIERSAGIRLMIRQVFRAKLPYDNIMTSVEATSRSEAWAVGSSANSRADLRSYAVHWNGRSWKMVSFPVSGFSATLVQASSRHDVWFFGRTGTGQEALRWDGRRWHAIAVPQQDDILRAVVLSPSDVWVNGSSYWHEASGWTARLWHWNGRAWNRYALPVMADDQFDIGGSSGGNLWAVGTRTSSRFYNTAAGLVIAYEWNGSAWRRKTVPHVHLEGPVQVAVSSSGEVWIVGQGTSRRRHKPVVLYRVHGKWAMLPGRATDMATPERIIGEPFADGLNGVWFAFSLYWSGRVAAGIIMPPIACNGGIWIDPAGTYLTGIPRSHKVLTAAGCQHALNGRIQGVISITRPR